MPELNKFAYGALAGKMLNERADDKYVKGSLDALAHSLDLSEEAKGFIEGAYRSKQGIQTAVEVYSKSFREEMNTATGTDLKNWYAENMFEGLSDTDRLTLETKLTTHGDQTYGDISRQYRLAATKANAPEGDYTPEEVAAAREVAAQYQDFIVVNQELEEFKLESIRSEAINFGRRRALRELVNPRI